MAAHWPYAHYPTAIHTRERDRTDLHAWSPHALYKLSLYVLEGQVVESEKPPDDSNTILTVLTAIRTRA